MIESSFYLMGKLEGQNIRYTMSGNPLEIKTFKNNQLNGPYKLFKQQGLDTYGEYRNNLKSGPWIEHKYAKGGPDEGSYVDGKKMGEWKLGATNLENGSI